MLESNMYGKSTISIHAGEPKDQYGAVIPPIYQTSTFEYNTTFAAAKAFGDFHKTNGYTRLHNPTNTVLEEKMAQLEHGKYAVTFASGMAAITGALFALLGKGDHAIFVKGKYSGTEEVTTMYFPKFGIEYDNFDPLHMEELEPMIKPNTKLIYLETPANPTLVMADIEEVCKIAKRHGVKVAVDNTFASPINTNPIDFGADIVIHSMTKYINGHGDTLGGVVICNDCEYADAVRFGSLMHLGAVLSPNAAYLIARGLKTLEVRMQRHNENAMKVAEFLNNSDKISVVRYPFLKSNPQYAIAKKQMRGGGGMVTFDVAGGLEAGQKFMNKLKLAKIAVSLGDPITLVEQAAAMTHTMIPREDREAAGITDGMIRMSVGLENAEDLIADLKQALED